MFKNLLIFSSLATSLHASAGIKPLGWNVEACRTGPAIYSIPFSQTNDIESYGLPDYSFTLELANENGEGIYHFSQYVINTFSLY